MPRLYIFAEGQTEQTFASNTLGPHLANWGIYVSTILVANAKHRGKFNRGGATNYEPMRKDICNKLSEHRSRDVFFTTMIDLYKISREFPGLEAAEKVRHLPHQQVNILETAFGDDLGDARFLPHIQLHEYEAYLFAEPSWFEYFYEKRQSRIATLKAVADQHDSPELIGSESQPAPSTRIIAQFPDYDKLVVGTGVAALIGLPTIRDRCPHFAAWLTRLEQLGNPLPETPD